MSEFTLIDHYFNWPVRCDSVLKSVGDDAAIVQPPVGEVLLMSVDTLVNGVHFPLDAPAEAIGHKALAVNLSDLAAMGAEPRWFTLALTLPEQDPDWLAAFSRGLRQLAEQYRIELIGGDTTRGPLSITIQVIGSAPAGMALQRDGAKPGDLIAVTGTPGDAAAGLAVWQNRLVLDEPHRSYCIQRLHQPTPRVAAGLVLRGQASSCLDISDGLLADLGHILEQSVCGARIDHQSLPFSAALRDLETAQKIPLVLTGGDDYELLFTLPPANLAKLSSELARVGVTFSIIGEITADAGKLALDYALGNRAPGYNHFKQDSAE